MRRDFILLLSLMVAVLDLIQGYTNHAPHSIWKGRAAIIRKPTGLRAFKSQINHLATPKSIIAVSDLIPTLPDPSCSKDNRIRLAELLQRTTLCEISFQKIDKIKTDFLKFLSKTDQQPRDSAKTRLVVIGSGWAAEAIAQTIDNKKFELVLISPRSFFIFTPMLASAAVGTVEYRSITEPVRRTNPSIKFFLATATDIDPNQKLVFCSSQVQGREQFTVSYDYLVVAIGTTKNTFNTPGASENCFFLKEIADARSLRAGIVQRFEAASLPGMPEDRIRKLLTFAVIGGGPSGVEMIGELADFILQVQIIIIEIRDTGRQRRQPSPTYQRHRPNDVG